MSESYEEDSWVCLISRTLLYLQDMIPVHVS